MAGFFTYLIQSTAILGIFYLVFVLFLRKDAFFALKRYFLLSGIIIATFLPLFDIPFKISGQQGAEFMHLLDTVVVTPSEIQESISGSSYLLYWVQFGYILVSLALALLFFTRVARLMAVVRINMSRNDTQPGLIDIPEEWSPFSFFGYIFINRSKYSSRELNRIIQHEEVHVRHWHSADVVLLELLFALHWFNPLFWLYRKSLKNIHEYIADRAVIENGFDISKYQQLIFTEATGIAVSPVTNNFSKSILKRRLIMMKKKDPRKRGVLKYLLLGPLTLAIAVVFTLSPTNELFSQVDTELPPPPPKANSDMAIGTPDVPPVPSQQKEEMVYKEVSKPPQYKGGQRALVEYIANSVKYPQKAKEEGIAGKVFVSFIVRKTGDITGVSVLKGAHELLDNEAVRVIKSMPAWIPGEDENGNPVNVQLTLPISFNLDEEKEK